MSNTLGIAEIIIDRRLPRHESYYDYLVGELKLKPGDLVEVSFRNKICRGVVYQLKQHSEVNATRLKAVSKIVMPEYLFDWQIKLLSWLSQNYGVSLGQALLMFTNVQPNNRFKPVFPAPANKLTSKGQKNVHNLVYQNIAARQNYVTTLMNKVLARHQQVLLLVPELPEINFWSDFLAKDFSILKYHSSLSQTESQAIWQKIKNGDKVCVIGTRAALFLPWQNLGGIIIDSSENENYKQYDQNPRYESNEVAEYIGQILSIPVAKISALPRLFDWFKYKKKLSSWSSAGKLQSKLKLVDISNRESKTQSYLLSDALINSVTSDLSKGQVYLYVNRLGYSTSVICQDCNFKPVCQICNRSLVWSENSKKTICYHCRLSFDIPTVCPNCQGVNFKLAGAGLDKIHQEVKKIWPKAQVALVTADNKQNITPELNSANIIVGTRAAWSILDKSKISLIGLVDLAAELSQPEFNALEEVYAFIRNCQANTSADIVIQAKGQNYENLLFVNESIESFYAQEIIKRENFSYPPVASLIKLITQNVNELAAKKMATATFIHLKKTFPKLDIIGPYPDYYRQLRGRWRFHILIKYQATDNLNIKQLWFEMPKDIIIDKDPIHVLT